MVIVAVAVVVVVVMVVSVLFSRCGNEKDWSTLAGPQFR